MRKTKEIVAMTQFSRCFLCGVLLNSMLMFSACGTHPPQTSSLLPESSSQLSMPESTESTGSAAQQAESGANASVLPDSSQSGAEQGEKTDQGQIFDPVPGIAPQLASLNKKESYGYYCDAGVSNGKDFSYMLSVYSTDVNTRNSMWKQCLVRAEKDFFTICGTARLQRRLSARARFSGRPRPPARSAAQRHGAKQI